MIDYVHHVRQESERFTNAIRSADADAVVPTCPDWTATDLLWHLCQVQHFWSFIVEHRPAKPADYDRPTQPADIPSTLEAFEQWSAHLATQLADLPDDTPMWTWLDSEQNLGFVRRRQAHEALIHRVDAELTAGSPLSLIDPELAADGVLEAFEWHFGGAPDWAAVTLDGPIGRIHATDVPGGDVTVQLGTFSGINPDSGNAYSDEPLLEVVRGAAPTAPDFQVSGTAADLDLWVWNRGPASTLNISGDASGLQVLLGLGVD